MVVYRDVTGRLSDGPSMPVKSCPGGSFGARSLATVSWKVYVFYAEQWYIYIEYIWRGKLRTSIHRQENANFPRQNVNLEEANIGHVTS